MIAYINNKLLILNDSIIANENIVKGIKVSIGDNPVKQDQVVSLVGKKVNADNNEIFKINFFSK